MDAPTWTVGPSRPIEAPQSRPIIMTMILPNEVFSETSALRSLASSICRAAMTCGMPEPCEFGKTVRARKTQNAKPNGVTTSARPSA